MPWQERKQYRYEGPEIIYTFWAKHGPCQREGCGHRTPIMSTPVVAIKTLTVDCVARSTSVAAARRNSMWSGTRRGWPRTAPLFVAPDEKPFAVMDDKGRFACPHCGKAKQDERAFASGNSSDLGKAKSKKVELTLLIHPQWLEGCPKHDEQGREYGGSATDSVEATIRWNNARAAKLRLLEVRGNTARTSYLPGNKVTFYTDGRGGTVPKKSTFACAADGSPNDVLAAIKATNKTGPIGRIRRPRLTVPQRESADQPYGGRFFAPASR